MVLIKWIDIGSRVDVVYLDFQKAFDKSSQSEIDGKTKEPLFR